MDKKCAIVALALAMGAVPAWPEQAPPPFLGFHVVAEYPHDPSAYTEGLVYSKGHLFESTGLVGQSSVREVDLASGRVLRSREVAPPDFGEGLAEMGDRWLQLTWTTHRGFVYDANFKPLAEFHYASEGWGLTYDGRRLILSDGSPRLQFLDPTRYTVTGILEVHDRGMPVKNLNELEAAPGRIYANIWLTDLIAVINPDSGNVQAWLDLSSLRDRFSTGADWNALENVPNGIAYDAEPDAGHGHLFVTGKRWPKVFELALDPLPPPH